VTNRPVDRPVLDATEEGFSFVFGQLLGIADLVDAAILWNDDSADSERTCPCSPADLIDGERLLSRIKDI